MTPAHNAPCRWLKRLAHVVILAIALTQAGCDNSRDAPPEPAQSDGQSGTDSTDEGSVTRIRFADVAAQCGIEFVPRNGREAGHFTILESLGTGVALVDFDNDGRLDIVAPGGGTFDETGVPVGRPTGLFRQNAGFQFTGVADEANVNGERRPYTHGVVSGDWNNDGFEDLVVTGYRSVRIFQNAGDGTFLDVTDQAGLRQDAWATSAAFIDADADGCVELFVVNYVHWEPDPDRKCEVKGHRDVCPPGDFDAAADFLYQNQGDGSFIERATSAGIIEEGKGLAVIAGDIDLDGDSDLYIANDTTANFLYLNDGTGQFSEHALVSGCALGATLEAEGSMGVELADFNADGYPDIWVSNYENQSFAMYQSRGPGIFQHVSSVTGISAVGQLYVGFGTVALDADLDGDDDIFAANGHVMYLSGTGPSRQQPLIYENQDGRLFRNVAHETGEYGRSLHMGRGVACGDLDRDGRPDLVVSHINEPLAILRNTTETEERLCTLKLVGRTSNRSAVGAIVSPRNSPSPRLRVSGGSYLSSSPPSVMWASKRRDNDVTITIRWPSGATQIAKIAENTGVLVIEPVAQPRQPR